MSNIFTNRKSGGVWSVDGAVLSSPDFAGLLVTSVNVNFQRSQQKISPLNVDEKFTITGDSSGTLNVGHIIGPSKDIETFIQKFATDCPKGGAILNISPQSVKACKDGVKDGGKAPVFTCEGLVLSAIGFTVQSAGGGLSLINGTLAFTFDNLRLSNPANGSGSTGSSGVSGSSFTGTGS